MYIARYSYSYRHKQGRTLLNQCAYNVNWKLTSTSKKNCIKISKGFRNCINNSKEFRNMHKKKKKKSIETSGGISVIWPIAFLWGPAFWNPLQSGPKCAPRDLGVVILKEMRWVKLLRHHCSLCKSLGTRDTPLTDDHIDWDPDSMTCDDFDPLMYLMGFQQGEADQASDGDLFSLPALRLMPYTSPELPSPFHLLLRTQGGYVSHAPLCVCITHSFFFSCGVGM